LFIDKLESLLSVIIAAYIGRWPMLCSGFEVSYYNDLTKQKAQLGPVLLIALSMPQTFMIVHSHLFSTSKHKGAWRLDFTTFQEIENRRVT
jgi:hypothetical protein